MNYREMRNDQLARPEPVVIVTRAAPTDAEIETAWRALLIPPVPEEAPAALAERIARAELRMARRDAGVENPVLSAPARPVKARSAALPARRAPEPLWAGNAVVRCPICGHALRVTIGGFACACGA